MAAVGGQGADAEVGGEELARRRELCLDVSGVCVSVFRPSPSLGDGAVVTYCWTWRKGSSSFVEDIILLYRIRRYPSVHLETARNRWGRVATTGRGGAGVRVVLDCGGRHSVTALAMTRFRTSQRRATCQTRYR